MIFENLESFMKKWKVRLMTKQEDIERAQKLMEKIDKEEPKEVENSDGYWEFIMPDGKGVK